jgi:hypothetical protein
MASSSKRSADHHWLEKVTLQALPKLQPNTRLRGVDEEDTKNWYGYTYHLYYPADPKEPPIRVVYYLEKFYQFFHHKSGNPYLGPIHPEATEYKLANAKSTNDEQDQLTLQIQKSLVIVDKDQPGSPERR